MLILGNDQAICALDLDERLGILTVEGLERRHPLIRRTVALGLVNTGSDSVKLGVVEIVGKSFTLISGPLRGARLFFSLETES